MGRPARSQNDHLCNTGRSCRGRGRVRQKKTQKQSIGCNSHTQTLLSGVVSSVTPVETAAAAAVRRSATSVVMLLPRLSRLCVYRTWVHSLCPFVPQSTATGDGQHMPVAGQAQNNNDSRTYTQTPRLVVTPTFIHQSTYPRLGYASRGRAVRLVTLGGFQDGVDGFGGLLGEDGKIRPLFLDLGEKLGVLQPPEVLQHLRVHLLSSKSHHNPRPQRAVVSRGRYGIQAKGQC